MLDKVDERSKSEKETPIYPPLERNAVAMTHSSGNKVLARGKIGDRPTSHTPTATKVKNQRLYLQGKEFSTFR